MNVLDSFANRGGLHMDKIDAFAAWAEGRGYRREPTKGAYEVLRLRKGKEAPLLYYRRERLNVSGGSPKHATSRGAGNALLRAWFRDRRKNERSGA